MTIPSLATDPGGAIFMRIEAKLCPLLTAVGAREIRGRLRASRGIEITAPPSRSESARHQAIDLR